MRRQGAVSIYELFGAKSDGATGKTRGLDGFDVFTKYMMGENYRGRITKRLIRDKIAKIEQET